MAENYLRGTCALCGGNLEFPERGLGERIPCPHCKIEIALTGTRPASIPKKAISPKTMLVGIGVVALIAISIYLAGAPKRKAQAAFRDQVIGLRVAINEGLNIGELRNRKKELLTFFEINRASLVKSKAVFDKMDIFLSAALFFWEESISHPGRDHAFDDERVWIQLIGEPLPGKFGSSESGLGDSGLLTPMSYRNIALKKVTEQAQALVVLLN